MFKNELSNEQLLKRVKSRSAEDVRSPYYRDTTAIIHSSPFRRLKHKTQVFFAPSNDHICTRMEHVLHVASIATTICRAMGLNDEMAWAIGVGHDLGHTPFGHIGEFILSDMMKEKGFVGFEHEVNSLRVVDFLSHLNLTYAVRDGIVSHCGEHFIRTLEPSHKITTLMQLKPSTILFLPLGKVVLLDFLIKLLILDVILRMLHVLVLYLKTMFQTFALRFWALQMARLSILLLKISLPIQKKRV